MNQGFERDAEIKIMTLVLEITFKTCWFVYLCFSKQNMNLLPLLIESSCFTTVIGLDWNG